MFCQTRKCQSNWQKANDKFLRINAWQESMKRLLTFTLLQSRVKRLEMVIFTASTFPSPFQWTENWYFQRERSNHRCQRRGQDQVCQRKTTHFVFLRTWVRDYGCRTHYIFHLNCRNSRLMKKFRGILIKEMWKYWHCLTPPVITRLHSSYRQNIKLKPSSWYSLRHLDMAGMRDDLPLLTSTWQCVTTRLTVPN